MTHLMTLPRRQQERKCYGPARPGDGPVVSREVKADGDAPYVLLVALGQRVPDRVTKFAESLIDQGFVVESLVVDRRRQEKWETDPRICVHHVLEAEGWHPVRRVEWFIVCRVPRGLLTRVKRLIERSRPMRRFVRPVDALLAVQRRGTRVVHRQLFMRAYRHVRPLLLARSAISSLTWPADRQPDAIIAADLDSVTLAWRLAQRYPEAVAIAKLDIAMLASHISTTHLKP